MDGLERFVQAQADSYARALRDIKSGRKTSHWMWYIFPQLSGLGHSQTARYYAIRDRAEAEAYLAHPVLGKRLLEISSELLKLESSDATAVMGWPDDLKLKSSMTLFSLVSREPVFRQVLEKYFRGEEDVYTVQAISRQADDV
ncbi:MULTISPECIES: DUF1810 domain-containing protein [Enterocloster]|uniref:DUF1810 domain-containing protein n=1 Tax=Enterocloster TaxID=2719313 RepID=UPI0023F4F6F4|nr:MULTISPECIES: DUF1810 domain-containing protein [Enterocloster]MDR3759445.1 DUF1810 domain-containing protein [Enterocloster sp.]